MTREEFIENGIDYDAAMNLFMGSEAMYIKFLAKFLNDESYGKLKEGIANNDCDASFRAAHTLKGVAGNLSLKSLAKAASDITEEFRAGNFEAGLKFIETLDKEYEKTISVIRSLTE